LILSEFFIDNGKTLVRPHFAINKKKFFRCFCWVAFCLY